MAMRDCPLFRLTGFCHDGHPAAIHEATGALGPVVMFPALYDVGPTLDVNDFTNFMGSFRKQAATTATGERVRIVDGAVAVNKISTMRGTVYMMYTSIEDAAEAVANLNGAVLEWSENFQEIVALRTRMADLDGGACNRYEASTQEKKNKSKMHMKCGVNCPWLHLQRLGWKDHKNRFGPRSLKKKNWEGMNDDADK